MVYRERFLIQLNNCFAHSNEGNNLMFSFVPREKEPREQIPVPQVMIKVFSAGMLQFSTGLSATF